MEGGAFDANAVEPIASARRLPRKSARNFTQVVSDELLHPRHSEESGDAFVREIYRLKGFAHLRNQQKLVAMRGEDRENYTPAEQAEQQLFVVKAASSFQKALGVDGQVVQKLSN